MCRVARDEVGGGGLQHLLRVQEDPPKHAAQLVALAIVGSGGGGDIDIGNSRRQAEGGEVFLSVTFNKSARVGRPNDVPDYPPPARVLRTAGIEDEGVGGFQLHVGHRIYIREDIRR